MLNDESVQHLHVLTHDANWSDEVLSPRQRFKKALFDHAERLYNAQNCDLHAWGMKFIDDNEE